MSRVALNTVIVLAVLAGLYVIWQLRAAALLFLLSLALAASLRPAIAWLSRHGLPPLVALAITYLLVFGLVGLLMTAAAAPLVTQTQRFADDFMLAYQSLYERWNDPDRGPAPGITKLPPPGDFFEALAGEQGAALLQTLLGATFTLFGMIVDLVIVVFLGIYWSLDQVHFERLWLSLLPVERRRAAAELWRAIEVELGAYVRSEAVQTIAAGLLLWLGYICLDQRYPVLMATIGAVAWLIPWVGVLLAVGAVALLSAPMVLVAPHSALTSLLPAVAYTSAVLLVMQVQVEPRLFDRRRYNALLTAIIIFGMAEVAGVTGLVLGAPLAAALQIAGGQWMRWRLATAAEAVEEVSFEQRLAAVRASLERRKRPTPEIANLVERLDSLVKNAEELLDRPAAEETEDPRLVAEAPAS